jgi:hypothetical protein
MEYTVFSYIDGVLSSIIWLYFLPGNLLVSCLSNTDIGQFYEFSNADHDGVFSFFVPWFFIAFLMASIDDTKGGRIILLNKGKRILTKNGRKRVGLLFIALVILGSTYLALHSLDVKNSWIDLLFIIFITLTIWYVLLTNGYSFKKNKFKKAKQIIVKRGKKDFRKLLLWPAILLVLFLASRFINYSCFFIILIIPILFTVFYLSVGNRWRKLKINFIKTYKKIKIYFKK